MTGFSIRTRLLHASLWLFLAMPSIKVNGADIRSNISGSGVYRTISIEGEIVPGDYEKFIKIVEDNNGKMNSVYLFSPGGDFYEAMKIGGAMRALELSSQVPMRDSRGRPTCFDDGTDVSPMPRNIENCTCASACFFMHIGAVHRGGTYIAVHRPFFVKGDFGELSQANAKKAFDLLQQKARDYMKDMGVPGHVQEDVLGTPSDNILLLDEKTIKTYFWGKLPYHHEWIRNKCSELTAEETYELKGLYEKFIHVGFSFDALTPKEKTRMNLLSEKEEVGGECAIAVDEQGRLEAYENFFGAKPTDYKSHDFSIWVLANKFLGKRFRALISEGTFIEESLGGKNSLVRNATASEPYIRLSDSHASPRVVGWINLVGAPNPSEEFVRRLVSSLEIAWGKSITSGSPRKWSWDMDGYSAELTHESHSGTGPYMSLVIEEK